MASKMEKEKTSRISYVVFISAIIVVVLNLISLFFPGLFITMTADFETNVDPFELGVSTVPVLVTNLVLLGIGILHYRKILPAKIQDSVRFILNFEVSPKVAGIVVVILLGGYIAFTSQDLSVNEINEIPDFDKVEKALENYPNEGLHGYAAVKFFLLHTSQVIFQNVKVIPFIGSISLLLVTYLFTVEITKKRFPGLVALAILLQSHTFLQYDTIATYPNFWTLFFIISLYMIYKKWYLSPVMYVVSIFSKPLTAVFFPMTLFFTYRAEIPKEKKIRIAISYAIIFVIMIGILLAGLSIPDMLEGFESTAGILEGFDYSDFSSGFTAWAFQLRFDWAVLLFILPLTVGLFLTSRRGIPEADSILVLLVGILILGPLLVGFTHYLINPYRFMPLIVFFAVGVGTLLSKRINQKD